MACSPAIAVRLSFVLSYSIHLEAWSRHRAEAGSSLRRVRSLFRVRFRRRPANVVKLRHSAQTNTHVICRNVDELEVE